MTSNRLGFKGEEDLGNGLKAGFTYELGLNYENGGSGLGGTARQSFIHLTDSTMGALSIGRQYSPIFSASASYDAGNANNLVAGRTVYGKATTVAPASTTLPSPDTFTRVNGVMYTSPTMAGVTVKLFSGQDKTTKEDVTGPAGTTGAQAGVAESSKNQGASVSFTNGPLSLTAASHTYKNLDALTAGFGDLKTRANLIGASYDFGVAKIMVSSMNNKLLQTSLQAYSYKGTQYGVTAPINGKVDAFATYGRGKSDWIENVRAFDHKAYQLGAAYSFSKRTNVYLAMGHEVATQVTPNTDVTIKQTVAGLRHSF